MWDLETGYEVRTLQGHSLNVLAVVLTRDGRRAVSGSEDNTLKVWDVENGRATGMSQFHDHEYIQVAKAGGKDHEEVARHDYLGRVMDERQPTLVSFARFSHRNRGASLSMARN